jgi:hypothetical protein
LDSITKQRALVVALVFSLLQVPAQFCAEPQDLHAQSAAAALSREFADPDLSYLLLDEEGQVMAERWEHPERDIPVGSLVKPFIAVAYGRTHRSFPKFRCAGGKTCWLSRGHGTLTLREAIAFSCNSYFHQLVARAGNGFQPALASFGLQSNVHEETQRLLTIASPLALARAYLELTRHASEPAVAPVLAGLALSPKKGTAKAVGEELPGMRVLAKTGTAPCTHQRKAPGDGFALVMFPADHPRAALLVRLHGRPGYMAAEMAGRMIAKIEAGAAR